MKRIYKTDLVKKNRIITILIETGRPSLKFLEFYSIKYFTIEFDRSIRSENSPATHKNSPLITKNQNRINKETIAIFNL